jgi:hypothetical protein
MRLKAEIWIKAYIRRCAGEGSSAVVVRHGDDDAGAIFIRVNRLDGTSLLFGPAPAGFIEAARDRQWVACLDASGAVDEKVDAYLAREVEFDPDLWIVEVEDRGGRHFLQDWLAEQSG